MKQKVVVLGAGRVGTVIAADLSWEFEVTSVDMDRHALEMLSTRWPVITQVADLSHPESMRDILQDADLVISAVPGRIGFNTLKTVIDCGKSVVDISFFPEDAFALDKFAVRRGITAVVDCGVAPGIPDFLAGFFAQQMKIRNFEFVVGGLHFGRTEPHRYLPTFSPSDVWEEYTRPARYVRNGTVVTMPPLSEPEFIQLQIGERPVVLEAFNTDGLRSLITTMAGRIPNMREKTLRYPGHIAYIKKLRQAVAVWTPDIRTPDDDKDEFTIMQITIQASEGAREKKFSYTLFDVYDPILRLSSMSRTTGYTCTGVARCVLGGAYQQVGISPPSYVGESPGCMHRIFRHLSERNIVLRQGEESFV